MLINTDITHFFLIIILKINLIDHPIFFLNMLQPTYILLYCLLMYI